MRQIFRIGIGTVLVIYTAATYSAEPQNAIDPIQELSRGIAERTQKTQKRVLQRLKEQQNISDANRLYYKKHPDAPRIKEPTSNALGIAVGEAFRIPLPTNNDDSDPRKNPEQWDSIASSSKKCWFHKSTRKKVCEDANQ